jgi:hypothetical protein
MLTHVHKVIHKVAGTFVRVFERKKQRRKRSLEVTGRWPRRHLRIQSVQAEVRAKGLSEETLVAVHRRVWCIFARQRTQATGRSASMSSANDVSVWQGRVITGRWGVSDRPPADVSSACFPSLVPVGSPGRLRRTRGVNRPIKIQLQILSVDRAALPAYE